MRLLNLIVAAALILAAGYVYKIKFESTVQAERVARLRAEIIRERDAIAALRAEWSKLESPARIQALARRHLSLVPLDPAQIDSLDRLPERPREVEPGAAPEIGTAMTEGSAADRPTGSISPRLHPERKR